MLVRRTASINSSGHYQNSDVGVAATTTMTTAASGGRATTTTRNGGLLRTLLRGKGAVVKSAASALAFATACSVTTTTSTPVASGYQDAVGHLLLDEQAGGGSSSDFFALQPPPSSRQGIQQFLSPAVVSVCVGPNRYSTLVSSKAKTHKPSITSTPRGQYSLIYQPGSGPQKEGQVPHEPDLPRIICITPIDESEKQQSNGASNSNNNNLTLVQKNCIAWLVMVVVGLWTLRYFFEGESYHEEVMRTCAEFIDKLLQLNGSIPHADILRSILQNGTAFHDVKVFNSLQGSGVLPCQRAKIVKY